MELWAPIATLAERLLCANLVSYAFLWWRVGEWGAAREGNTKISGIGLEPDVSWPMSAGIGTRLIQCGSPTRNTKLNCAPTAPNYSGAVAFEFVRDTRSI